jgi:WD40 repeat protein
VAPSTINSDKLGDDDEDEKKPDRRGSMQSQVDKPYITLFKEPRNQVNFVRAPRLVETRALETSEKPQKGTPETEKGDQTLVRYPVVMFNLPEAVGGSLQIHPKDKTAGLAVLANGTLILFRAPSDIWNEYSELLQPVVKIVTLWEDDTVTSAAFSHVGDRIFLATKAGDLLGLDISYILYGLTTSAEELPKPKLIFKLQVGSMAWHLIVSRNGKHILLNCSDGALRLYSTQECIEGASWLKPKVFQDVVSKEPFVCCDFSGDGEYIVGGCNGVRDDKYELYLWSAATGALMDRLTGAPVSLYSVAWHPTRSFLAVATGDGLVDIWGPRMDWTAFAPDFQALPVNVEYVEEEDEFDFVENGEDKGSTKGDDTDDVVDVVTLEAVPVFASDSENEEEVFTFETKMNNLMFGRGRNRAEGKTGSDDKD